MSLYYSPSNISEARLKSVAREIVQLMMRAEMDVSDVRVRERHTA